MVTSQCRRRHSQLSPVERRDSTLPPLPPLDAINTNNQVQQANVTILPCGAPPVKRHDANLSWNDKNLGSRMKKATYLAIGKRVRDYKKTVSGSESKNIYNAVVLRVDETAVEWNA